MIGRRLWLLPTALLSLFFLGHSARADDLGVTVRQTRGGVEVVSVTRKGLAAQLGFAPMDRIQEVNGNPIRTQADLRDALSPRNPDLVIRILRAGRNETIRAKVYWPAKGGPPVVTKRMVER